MIGKQRAVEHLHDDQQRDHRQIRHEGQPGAEDDQRREQPEKQPRPPEIEVNALGRAERLADRVGRRQRQHSARQQRRPEQADAEKRFRRTSRRRVRARGRRRRRC